MGKVNPGALKQPTVFDEPGNAAATFGTLPAVTQERMAIELGQPLDDRFLQIEKRLPDGAVIHYSRKPN